MNKTYQSLHTFTSPPLFHFLSSKLGSSTMLVSRTMSQGYMQTVRSILLGAGLWRSSSTFELLVFPFLSASSLCLYRSGRKDAASLYLLGAEVMAFFHLLSDLEPTKSSEYQNYCFP